MNDAVRNEALLRRRAAQVAAPVARAEPEESRAYLSCIVGARRVGLPVENVLGVFHLPPVTPVPGSSQVLRGVAQVRGRLVAVVDLAEALGEPRGARPALLALVEGAPGQVGLLIDRTERLVEIPVQDHCQHLPQDATEPFVRAVSQDLLTLIDIEALLASPLVRASTVRTSRTSASIPSAPGRIP